MHQKNQSTSLKLKERCKKNLTGFLCGHYFNYLFLIYSRSLSGDEDGMLCDTISRKTLFYLIATLNAAFPDYDFSMAKVSKKALASELLKLYSIVYFCPTV